MPRPTSKKTQKQTDMVVTGSKVNVRAAPESRNKAPKTDADFCSILPKNWPKTKEPMDHPKLSAIMARPTCMGDLPCAPWI